MFTKLIRLGRDAEMKTTQSGKAVCEFTGAYDVGYGQNKQTQWVKCSLWGDRGEKVAQYLVKGSQVVVTLSDLRARAFINKNTNEPQAALEGRVIEFDFAGDKPSDNQAPQQNYHQQAPQQQPQQQAPQQQPAPSGFDDFDDEIPF